MATEHNCDTKKEALWDMSDVAALKEEAYGIKLEKPKVEPMESKYISAT